MVSENVERLLLRPTEAFVMTGLSRSVGYGLIAAGEWPAVRVGRALRIPADGLRDWIERKRSEQVSAEPRAHDAAPKNQFS